MPQVAQALATDILFPPHFEVANAVGAAVGHVVIRGDGEVYPCVEGTTITGYFARMASRQEKFRTYPEALAFARDSLTNTIHEESLVAGGKDGKVEIEVDAFIDGMAHLHAWSIS